FLEPSELAEHEAALDGGEDGLEHGRLEQAGLLPLRDGDFADAGGGPRLAGDSEDHKIRPLEVASPKGSNRVASIRTTLSGRSRHSTLVASLLQTTGYKGSTRASGRSSARCSR